jgi:hypothetical protein
VLGSPRRPPAGQFTTKTRGASLAAQRRAGGLAERARSTGSATEERAPSAARERAQAACGELLGGEARHGAAAGDQGVRGDEVEDVGADAGVARHRLDRVAEVRVGGDLHADLALLDLRRRRRRVERELLIDQRRVRLHAGELVERAEAARRAVFVREGERAPDRLLAEHLAEDVLAPARLRHHVEDHLHAIARGMRLRIEHLDAEPALHQALLLHHVGEHSLDDGGCHVAGARGAARDLEERAAAPEALLAREARAGERGEHARALRHHVLQLDGANVRLLGEHGERGGLVGDLQLVEVGADVRDVGDAGAGGGGGAAVQLEVLPPRLDVARLRDEGVERLGEVGAELVRGARRLEELRLQAADLILGEPRGRGDAHDRVAQLDDAARLFGDADAGADATDRAKRPHRRAGEAGDVAPGAAQLGGGGRGESLEARLTPAEDVRQLVLAVDADPEFCFESHGRLVLLRDRLRLVR